MQPRCGFEQNSNSRALKLEQLLVCLLPMLLWGTDIFSQSWNREYDLDGNRQEARDICMTLDRQAYVAAGRYKITNSLARPHLLKVDQSGEEVWWHKYGSGTDYEAAWCLFPTSDNGFIMGGKTQSPYNTVVDDILVLRVDALGNELWRRQIDCPGNGIDNEGFDRLWDIKELENGNLVGVGMITYQNEDKDAGLIMMNSEADTLWMKCYGPTETAEEARAFAITSDGGFIIAGYYGYDEVAMKSQLYIIKTDAFGNVEWEETYGDPQVWTEARWITETPDGNYIVAALTEETNCESQAWVLKLSSTGSVIWSKTYGGSYDDWFSEGILLENGCLLFVGFTQSFSSNPGPDVSNRDGWIVKMNHSGDALWSKVCGKPGAADAFMAVDGPASDGGYICAGYTNGYYSCGEDVWLVKTDSLGGVADLTPPYQSGWPVSTNGNISSSPVVGDLDRDGDLDVVIVSGTDVWVFKANGTQFSDAWPKSVSSLLSSSEATLGDIDGDGKLEIIVNASNGVYAWNADGTPVYGWPQSTSLVHFPAISGDMSGSGDLDEVFAGNDAGFLNVWTEDGEDYFGFPVSYDWSIRNLAAGKIVPYVMFPPWYSNILISGRNFSYTQSFVGVWGAGWIKTFNDHRDICSSLGDIDGDGSLDILSVHNKYEGPPPGPNPILSEGVDDSLYIWDYSGIELESWPRGDDNYWAYPAIGDIDGDKDLEVIVRGGSKVYVYDKDGNLLPGWPRGLYGSNASGSHSFAIGDIDGDSNVEIVAAGFYALYAWHLDGSLVLGFPIDIPGTVTYSSPALADLDADGDIEIIIGSGDGKVHVWDLAGTYNPANIEWSMFQRISEKTGCYPQVTIAVNPHQYEVPKGGTLDFSVVLANHTNITEALSVWVEVNYNGNIEYTSRNFNFNIQPLSSFTREVHQLIPNHAPRGIYTYKIKVRIDDQLVIADRGTFYFKVVANQNHEKKNTDWQLIWDDAIRRDVQEDANQKLLPTICYLSQNTPNPFSRMTVIRYQIPVKSNVCLKIYDIAGQLVKTLVDVPQNPGNYTITWNGKDQGERGVSNGIYFIKMEADDFAVTRKTLVLK